MFLSSDTITASNKVLVTRLVILADHQNLYNEIKRIITIRIHVSLVL